MKPLRNLQRGFGRLCLQNVALTTTPSVIEKTKEVVIPYPGAAKKQKGGLRAAPQTRNGVPFVLPGAGRVGSLTHATNGRLGPPTLPAQGRSASLTTGFLTPTETGTHHGESPSSGADGGANLPWGIRLLTSAPVRSGSSVSGENVREGPIPEVAGAWKNRILHPVLPSYAGAPLRGAHPRFERD
jgi:hypothetical protein